MTMLNLMENFPLPEFGPGSANSLHVGIEAKKLAYADMLRQAANTMSMIRAASRTSRKTISAVANRFYTDKQLWNMKGRGYKLRALVAPDGEELGMGIEPI